MSVEVATWVVLVARGYLYVGGAFAVCFALFLVGRVDHAVKDSSWGFRLAILPGSALLWPFLLLRVIRGGEPPEECNNHRDCAQPCPKRSEGAG